MSDFVATAIINIPIVVGREDEFLVWQTHLNNVVASFEGYVSTEVIDPRISGDAEFVVIYRFVSEHFLKKWLNSDERAEQLSLMPVDLISGIETMNVLVGEGTSERPVTAVINVYVSPEQTVAYREWQSRMSELMANQKGHLGTEVQEPIVGLQEEWLILAKFDCEENLALWLNSPQRKNMLEEAEKMIYSSSVKRTRTSFDGWFRFADGRRPPSPWQQSALVLLVLFPTVMFEIIFIIPFFADLSLSLRTFVANALSVSLTGLILIPASSKIFGWWLKPNLPKKKLLLGSIILVCSYIILIIFLNWLYNWVSFVPWFVV